MCLLGCFACVRVLVYRVCARECVCVMPAFLPVLPACQPRRLCLAVQLPVSLRLCEHPCMCISVFVFDDQSSSCSFAVPPVVVAATPSVTVVEGKTALLRCNVTGIPVPTLTWSRKDGKMLNRRFRLQSEGTLEIAVAETKDAGQYICMATNKGGNSTSSVALYVHCKWRVRVPTHLLLPNELC